MSDKTKATAAPVPKAKIWRIKTNLLLGRDYPDEALRGKELLAGAEVQLELTSENLVILSKAGVIEEVNI